MPVTVRTLADAEKEINRLRNELDVLRTKNIDLNGRRITNAGKSESPTDLVRKDELPTEAGPTVPNYLHDANIAYRNKNNKFSTVQDFLSDINVENIQTLVNILYMIGNEFFRFDTVFARRIDLGEDDDTRVNLQENGPEGPLFQLIQIGADLVELKSSPTEANAGLVIAGIRVMGKQIGGWGAPTGTPTRTSFDTTTVTLPQLAERVKALIDDQMEHGNIGA